MKLSGILLFILILSSFSGPRCAAAVWNSDGTPQNIQQIHDTQAQNGDTITIPPGTFTWSTGITITKAITLQGAGVGSTIIRDDVQSAQLILWSLAAGLPSRITGIEFQDGGRINTANAPGGILHIDGSNTSGSTFRFGHCKWNNLNGPTVFDTVIGVIDHNTFVTDRFSPEHLHLRHALERARQRRRLVGCAYRFRVFAMVVHRGQHFGSRRFNGRLCWRAIRRQAQPIQRWRHPKSRD